MMIRGINGTNALSLAAVRQRCWLAPCSVSELCEGIFSIAEDILKGSVLAGVYLYETEIRIMKKHVLLLLGASILSFNLASAQPAPSNGLLVPEDYVLVKTTNSLTKFDLDFPGGTPKDLVKAIEKATNKPLNAIIPDDCADLKISAITVKNVTMAQLFEVLIQASRKNERFTVLDPRDRSIGGNGSDIYVSNTSYGFSTVGMPAENSIWYFYWDRGREREPWQVLSSTVCKFYQLEPYLEAGYTVEDITTAVKTGWKMLGVTNAPQISYHKDTKVLIAVGEEDKVNLIGDVLKQLSTTPKEKSDDKDLPKSKDR
jgi:hypothetical protein